MTAKRQRGRKWAMLEAVATAMVHGWKVWDAGAGNRYGEAWVGWILYHPKSKRLLWVGLEGVSLCD